MIKRLALYAAVAVFVGLLFWGLAQDKEAGIKVFRDDVSESAEPSGRVVTVTVAADDTVSIDGQPIDPAEIEGFLGDIAIEDGRPASVIVDADPGSRDEVLIHVLQGMNEAVSVTISTGSD